MTTSGRVPTAAAGAAKKKKLKSEGELNHGPDVYSQPDLQLSRQLGLLRCDEAVVREQSAISDSVLATIQSKGLLCVHVVVFVCGSVCSCLGVCGTYLFACFFASSVLAACVPCRLVFMPPCVHSLS
jgi:hypothetical protein